jgi:hypothetical protein
MGLVTSSEAPTRLSSDFPLLLLYSTLLYSTLLDSTTLLYSSLLYLIREHGPAIALEVSVQTIHCTGNRASLTVHELTGLSTVFETLLFQSEPGTRSLRAH